MDGFEVKIEVGNDAMETPKHVADALRDIASRLDTGDVEGRIMDDNGNTVGKFMATYDA